MPEKDDLCWYGPHAPAPALLPIPTDDGTGDPMLPEMASAIRAANEREMEIWNRAIAARSPSPLIVNGDFRFRTNDTSAPFGWTLVGSPSLSYHTLVVAGLGHGIKWTGTQIGIQYQFNVKPCTWYTLVWDAYGEGKVVVGRDDGYGGVTEIESMEFSVGTTYWARFPNSSSGVFTFRTNGTDTTLLLRLLAMRAAQVAYSQVQMWEGSVPRPFQDNGQTNRTCAALGGSKKGLRPTLNFVAGTNASLTVADNSSTDSMDVTIGTSFTYVPAPQNATYLLLSANSDLPYARTFTPGTSLAITDGGAGLTYAINTIQGIRTTDSPQFARLGLGRGGSCERAIVRAGDHRAGAVGLRRINLHILHDEQFGHADGRPHGRHGPDIGAGGHRRQSIK